MRNTPPGLGSASTSSANQVLMCVGSVKRPGLAQYSNVLGHGWSCQLEASCDGTGRHLSLANKVHDLEPGLVAQCLNLCQDRQQSIEPALIFIDVRNNLRHNAPARKCAAVKRICEEGAQ